MRGHMRRPPIDIDDHRALAEFRYQIRKFLSFSERAARDAGIEPQQHQLLLALTGLPDGTAPTIGELADRLQIQHHSTVELVSRLAKREMVRRTRNPADRRQVFVELTDEGHEIMAQLSAVHLEELNRVGPELAHALSSIVEESVQVAPSRGA